MGAQRRCLIGFVVAIVFSVFFRIVGIRFVVSLMWITCVLCKANFKEIHSFIHVFLLLVLLM